jgi:hypothetical protein
LAFSWKIILKIGFGFGFDTFFKSFPFYGADEENIAAILLSYETYSSPKRGIFKREPPIRAQ